MTVTFLSLKGTAWPFGHYHIQPIFTARHVMNALARHVMDAVTARHVMDA